MIKEKNNFVINLLGILFLITIALLVYTSFRLATISSEKESLETKIKGYVLLDSVYTDDNSVTEIYNVYTVNQDSTIKVEPFFRVSRDKEVMERDVSLIKSYKLNLKNKEGATP